MRLRLRKPLLVVPVALVVVAGSAAGYTVLHSAEEASAASCAPGFVPVEQVLNEIRREMAGEGEHVTTAGDPDAEEAEEEAEEQAGPLAEEVADLELDD